MLANEVLPWLESQEWPHKYVFQQDGAPSHTANMVQQWCQDNFQRFWPKTFWPPSSPDLNVMDFAIWGILARKACEKPHANVGSLKRSLKKWADLDQEPIRNSCANAHERLEAVVEAKTVEDTR